MKSAAEVAEFDQCHAGTAATLDGFVEAHRKTTAAGLDRMDNLAACRRVLRETYNVDLLATLLAVAIDRLAGAP